MIVRGGAPRLPGAFTLIELMISAALMALILASAYACLNAGFASRKAIEPRADVLQSARVAMSIITADLRSACPLSTEDDFLGMHRTLGGNPADNLDFATHNYRPAHPREGDFCQESIFLARDRKTGSYALWRRRNPRIAPNALSGGNLEQIAVGLRGLQFEYFDGLDWFTTWGNVENKKQISAREKLKGHLSGFPEAVRVTLWFDPKTPDIVAKASETESKATNEPPIVFQTVARLELAGLLNANATSSATPSNPTDNSGANGPTPQQ